MKRNTEKSVRQRLRSMAGDKVRWVESAHGGTMGAPDAVVDTPVGLVELELKLWRVEKGHLVTKIRPVQRRYHLLATLAARRSGFLVGFDLSGDETKVLEKLLVGAASNNSLVLGVFSSGHMPSGLRRLAWEPKLRVVESFRDIELWAEDEWRCAK